VLSNCSLKIELSIEVPHFALCYPGRDVIVGIWEILFPELGRPGTIMDFKFFDAIR